MRRDIDTLRLIVEFCDAIADDIQHFGIDVEDFLEDKAYQRFATFSIEQIGELVKRLSSDLTEEFDDVIGTRSRRCATSSPTDTSI